jgi:hypothetical protein
MTNKEMFYFTGKCLALDEHPEFRLEIISNCVSDYIDWQQFVMLCSNHLILPAIYLKFRKYRILKYLPKEVSDHLFQIFELNVTRNKNIYIQLREITDTLNKNNIYPIFLKGAAHLLDGVYSSIGERMMGDIDFLVAEKDYLTAARIMKNEGYTKVRDTPTYKDIRYFKHYPRLIHQDFEAVIEIHRIPVDENYLSWFNSKTIESKKKTIASSIGCFVPSDRNKIIHNFIHSQLSGEGNLFGFVSLKDIYDLYLLSKKESLVETLSEIKAEQKAIAYFAISSIILGLGKTFFPKKNYSFKVLQKKHSLNLNSSVFFKIYRTIIFIGQRLFNGYIGQITKAIYSKRKRDYLLRRVSNPGWYSDHMRLYAGFFKPHK